MTGSPASCRLIAVVPADSAGTLPADAQVTWLGSGAVRAASVAPHFAPEEIANWQQAHFRTVPLIPLRGQPVLTPEQAQAWLDEQADVLAWFLEDVAGRAEWRLTAHRDPTLPPIDLPAEDDAASLAEWVWRRVRAGTDDACPLPIPAAAAAEGQFVQGAVLVSAANEPGWLATLEHLKEELRAIEVNLDRQGPCPAFHFTPFGS